MQFQFQYGSIKIASIAELQRPFFRFQFQYGSIKIPSMNGVVVGTSMFQFQYGSIKIFYIIAIAVIITPVSIPIWFD